MSLRAIRPRWPWSSRRSSSKSNAMPVPAARQEGVLADWRKRFDRILVLTAPDEMKIARYAAVSEPLPKRGKPQQRDARIRLARQIPDAEKAARADFVLENTGDLAALRAQVEALWQRLRAESNKSASRGSLE